MYFINIKKYILFKLYREKHGGKYQNRETEALTKAVQNYFLWEIHTSINNQKTKRQ